MSSTSLPPRPPAGGAQRDVWGEYVAGVMMAIAGLIGLFMASGAHDNEIYLFGLSLAGMSVVFIMRQLKRHYDLLDAQRARVAGDRHG